MNGLLGFDDVAGPLFEDDKGFVGAMIYRDAAMYDLENPAHLPFVPALSNTVVSSGCDPHGAIAGAGSVAHQIQTWLNEAVIENTCNGVCDGFASDGMYSPFETPYEASVLCDPLAPEQQKELPRRRERNAQNQTRTQSGACFQFRPRRATLRARDRAARSRSTHPGS